MTAKTKRIMGWTLLASLILGVLFGIPYGFYLYQPEEFLAPWYRPGFLILEALGVIAILIGIMLGVIGLINSKD